MLDILACSETLLRTDISDNDISKPDYHLPDRELGHCGVIA